MHKLGLVMLGLLAGCSGVRTTEVASFRTATTAPIYSNAVLQTDRMAGPWSQVAAFATTGAAPCPASGLRLDPAAGGFAATGALCLSGKVVPVAGRLTAAGPGRFALQGADPAGLGQTWWVLWADVDYRTLVIGTPTGAFGFILNRDGRLPADRRVAAVEILDFNGYRTDLLVALPKAQ